MNERIIYSIKNKPVILMKANSMKVCICYFYKCKLHIVYAYCDSSKEFIDNFTPELAEIFIDRLTEKINHRPWWKRKLNFEVTKI